MNENLDLDLIVDTKLYEYAKTGMELSLTILCQQLGADQYLSKNNFLKQEYSLTTPFSDYDNLEVFLETLNDVKDIAQNELLHRNDKQLYSIMENIDNLIATSTRLKDYFNLIEYKKNEEPELEPEY